ncbi:MAG: ATP-binding protein [Roseburia sp.]|nr:ATP-binding protein [Roseburia sp.]
MKAIRTKDAGQTNGYLVVEYDGCTPSRILYADAGACALTGLSREALLAAEPLQAVDGLETSQTALDAAHELWTLGGSEALSAAAFDRIREENLRLQEALRASEEENQAKSSFLSSMSHDIRTPMNAIMGMTSIGLSHIDEKSRVSDCLHKIQTASNHLMSLVNDVLDMSRIASGRMTLNEEAFSLADMVHDITIIIRPQAAQKRQEFHMEIGRIYEENLLGDPLRLRQILVNIIGNAIKYTQEEGQIRVVFSQHLDAAPESGSEQIRLDFLCEDNGIGMSPDFLKRIFVPFERVNSAAVNRIEGTGLGMSIVKNLLDRMGGDISVESTEGKGSRFRISIPFSTTPQEARPLPEGQTVLLAESTDSHARQIIEYLADSGLETIHIRNGMDAVTWLTEAQYENRMPCALLLGQELADMPILEMASHVRQLAGRDFPIILVAEIDWAQMEYRASRAGVSAFVPCPLFKSRLLSTVSDLTCGAQAHSDNSAGSDIDYSKYRLLLVEDNELNREIAMELLSLTGVQIEEAENGRQAVERFERSPEGYYDLIFMDIQMPVLNGYEATKQIRQLPRKDAQSVWIVAMTANAFVEDIRLSREAGMNEHCSKPVEMERLHDILRKRFKP